jgi:hypothetical protein
VTVASQTRSPGTLANDGSNGSFIAWTNPSNASASDDNQATAAIVSGPSPFTQYLKATNFGFTIPSDATITGFKVQVEKKITGSGSINDKRVSPVKGGTIEATDKASATAWPASDTVADYGADGDLWSLTWSPTDINATTFGVAVAANAVSGVSPIANIDYISITVYYTEAPPAPPPPTTRKTIDSHPGMWVTKLIGSDPKECAQNKSLYFDPDGHLHKVRDTNGYDVWHIDKPSILGVGPSVALGRFGECPDSSSSGSSGFVIPEAECVITQRMKDFKLHFEPDGHLRKILECGVEVWNLDKHIPVKFKVYAAPPETSSIPPSSGCMEHCHDVLGFLEKILYFDSDGHFYAIDTGETVEHLCGEVRTGCCPTTVMPATVQATIEWGCASISEFCAKAILTWNGLEGLDAAYQGEFYVDCEYGGLSTFTNRIGLKCVPVLGLCIWVLVVNDTNLHQLNLLGCCPLYLEGTGVSIPGDGNDGRWAICCDSASPGIDRIAPAATSRVTITEPDCFDLDCPTHVTFP